MIEAEKICSLGFGCKAKEVKHFMDFWHAPSKIRKHLKKHGIPATKEIA